MNSPGIADRLFDYDEEKDGPKDDAAEGDMIALLRSFSVPFERIDWDHYDGSLEIYQVPPDWRMAADLQRRLWDEGFIKAYVNHINDSWETHYSFGTAKGFEAKPGWRVSYPRKRGDDHGQIWVEQFVPSWPRKWFRRWLWWKQPYVVVKPSALPPPEGR